MVDPNAPALSPAQVISHYSGDQWEEFVDELVEGIQSTQGYLLVKRMGGPGDLGIDVAGFKTVNGLEGPWDCYQCKQYAAPLQPSDAWPEILKIFRAAAAQECAMPDAYLFVAPKGAGLKLNKLLSQPTKAKEEFIRWLAAHTPSPAMKGDERMRVDALVAATDFAMFDALQARHAISMHADTRYYALRFNSPLPERPEASAVPGAYTGDEKRYVDQLVAAYRERHPADDLDRDNVAAHPTRGGHFKRQRQAFFRAESLRVYARESTPDGTFEALQADVHAGVVELAESDHADGYTRAQAVLQASASIDLNSHRLIERADLDDRKGICHQLVNDERLTWVEEP
jgi:hypothetical protein